MGIIASINFKPTKNPVQVFHNDRSTPPNYLLPKERQLYTICNRSGLKAQALKQEMIDKAISAYIQRIGQKFQAKTYVYSAVVNLKSTHTMQDLEKLATHFKNKYGIQCYQIAIHRDEGHIDEFGNTHINHHAHMEFVTLDENTGKNNFKRVPSLMLKQIQTEVATILGMQRGIDKRISGIKRIEPRAYAKLMEQEKARRIELGEHQAKEVSTYQKQIKDLQASVENTQTKLHALQQAKTKLDQTNNALTQENTELKNLNATQEHTHQQTLATKAQEYQQALELKNASIHALYHKNTTLSQENQVLKDKQTELESTLIDLTTIFAPQHKQNKKLTLKEAKPLLESVRKQMIAINQGLGDLKLFTQEDYKALRALKDEGLSIADLKKRITQIEQEAKKRYEKLQEQYKDHLNPKQVEDKIAATKALYKDYLSPSAMQELKQEHTKELESREQSHSKALQEKDIEHAQVLKEKDKTLEKVAQELETKERQVQEHARDLADSNKALEKLTQELKAKDTEHTKELEALQTQHAKELEKAKNEIDKETKLQEYVGKVKTLLQRFVDQVINPMLEKLQTEKRAELEAVIQWKKDNEKEKAQYHAHLATLAYDLLAGKFPKINAMALLMGKGVKDAMSPEYFESIAKDRRDRFLNKHINEIEKSLNQELKPILAKIEQTREWEHKALLEGIRGLENSIGKLSEEFKNSDTYGQMLETAKGDAQYYKSRNLRLTTELGEKDKRIKTLEEENTKLRNTDLRLENNVQKTEITELKSQVESLQAQKDDLQREQDKLQTELTNTQTQLNEQIAITTQLKTDLKKSLASQQGRGKGI
ncbi:coiled-coil domain-containing protein [Helicobacter felis]|uniref:hypothetical protein n=1 Tax=Helicobacter felis TaxID=214 RepID=UPI0018F8616C|nr:hypothetical protein [Helicobacter felis]